MNEYKNSLRIQTCISLVNKLDINKKNILLVIQIDKRRIAFAKKIEKTWKKHSRGPENRLRKGILIALASQLTCYSPVRVKKRYKIMTKKCQSL